MEPLFTVKFEKTLKDIREFNWCNFNKIFYIGIIIGIIFNLLSLPKGHLILWLLVYFIINSCLWILLFWILNVISLFLLTKHNWKTDSSPIYSELNFYEDKFTEYDGLNTSTLEYKMLYKILETGSHFFLMISSNRGFIVRKTECSAQCIEFLQNKKREISH